MAGWGRLADAAPPVTKAKKNGSSVSKSNTGGPANPGPTATGPTTQLSPISTTALGVDELALAAEIGNAVKHAIACAASRPTRARFAQRSFAGLTQRYAAGLPASKRDAAARAATQLLKAPESKRTQIFGAFANKSPSVHFRPLNAVRPAVASIARSGALKRRVPITEMPRPSAGVKFTATPYKKAGFFLNEVRCSEETDEIGADHIKLAGAAISPAGATIKINPFTVSDDFDQGETVAYYPPNDSNFQPADPYRGRKLAEMVLTGPPTDRILATTPPGSFPAGYSLFLGMSEIDDGGFAELMQGLWDEIAAEVQRSLLAISTSFAGMFGPLIAEFIEMILREVLAFIVNIFDNEDDFVAGLSGVLTLNSPFDTYFNTLPGREVHAPANVWASQRQTWRFSGDGGHYRAKLHWRVWN